MDLLERYLHVVKFFLPQKQQDDIVGRHGHPMIVAGRYRSRQQLIGPVFFPIYLFALKTGLGVALLVTAVLAAVNGILHGDPVHYGVQAMLEYPGRSLMVFAWTTLGFAGLDIAQVKFKLKHDWDPRQLPRVVHHEYRIPRPRTLCELFFVLVSLVWLLLTGTLSNGVHVGHLVDIINASCQVGFVVAAIITAIEILRELRRMQSRRRAAYAVDSTV